jgi:hypothetical protein
VATGRAVATAVSSRTDSGGPVSIPNQHVFVMGKLALGQVCVRVVWMNHPCLVITRIAAVCRALASEDWEPSNKTTVSWVSEELPLVSPYGRAVGST